MKFSIKYRLNNDGSGNHFEEIDQALENDPIEYCSIGNGTTVRSYEWLKTVYNAWVNAVKDYQAFLQGADFLNLTLPGGLVFPLVDQNYQLELMPEKRFRGLRIGLRGADGDMLIYTDVALPKIPLLDWWKIFIQPIDTNIVGTDLYYYTNDLGEIKQGKDFVPPKFLKVLGDVVPLAIDIGLIVLLVYCLEKIGFFKIASTFIANLMKATTNLTVKAQLNQVQRTVDDIKNSLNDKFAEMNLNLSSKEDLNILSSKVDSIKDLVGVRLLLR